MCGVAGFISHSFRQNVPKTDRLALLGVAWAYCLLVAWRPSGFALARLLDFWAFLVLAHPWPHPWPHPWRLGGLVPSPVRCADLLRAEHGMGVLVSFYCYALAFHRLAFACYPYRLGLASYTVANAYLSACHLPTACVLPARLLDFWTFLVLAHPPRVPAPLPNMYHNIIKNSAAQVVTSTAPMFVEFVVGVGYRLLENITVKNRACRI